MVVWNIFSHILGIVYKYIQYDISPTDFHSILFQRGRATTSQVPDPKGRHCMTRSCHWAVFGIFGKPFGPPKWVKLGSETWVDKPHNLGYLGIWGPSSLYNYGYISTVPATGTAPPSIWVRFKKTTRTVLDDLGHFDDLTRGSCGWGEPLSRTSFPAPHLELS